MRYLHTMLRVRDLDAALDFYCNKLGLKETRRRVDEKNRYTLVFVAAPGDEKLVEDSKKTGRPGLEVELTYNWDTEDYGEARYFGHLAYEVDDIYETCDRLMKAGVTINRPPRDGVMAFVRSPDKHSIELLQKGAPKPPQEPWKSMGNYWKMVAGIRLPLAAKAFIPPEILLPVWPPYDDCATGRWPSALRLEA